jgi:hypothetical protein
MTPLPGVGAFCANPIYGTDGDGTGTRRARCGRFLTALDAERTAWKEARAA